MSPTDPDPRARFLRVQQLFEELVDLAPEERGARLAELEAEDAELARELAELVARDERTVDALEGSPARALGLAASVEAAPEIPGFRITGVLGTGGMGVVYAARQESPDRAVALKLIRPGFLTEELLRRFEHEGRVLGWLSHPGIATVYEAGRVDTPQGPQPFLAMELVEGMRVDRYVVEHLSGPGAVRARLALLARVCEAVQHAHQKGVVHRDLKPANILVTVEGQPKILDFGIARITEADLEATQATSAGEMLGTLPYMSPEQVRADPSAIDTRVDVYALGVIGYELLAGQRPHQLDSRALHEAARVILEDEPTKLGEVSPALRGDVATIVEKAMAKEKERRYASVEDLAEDIRRHLADEPIRAMPASRAYRLRKFARRNRLFLTAAALVVAGLVVGLVVALLGLGRAIEERNQKEVALRESEGVTEFLAETIAEVAPERAGKDVLLRDVLDDAAGKIAERFADEPRVAARLHQTVSAAYRTLGLSKEALPHARRSLELRRELLGERDADTVRSMQTLAIVLRRLGEFEEAELLLVDGLALAVELLGPDDRTTLKTRNELGNLYSDLARYAEAEVELRTTLEASTRLFGVDDDTALIALNNLAIATAMAGRFDEAETLFTDLLGRRLRVSGEDAPDTLSVMHNLATIYAMTGRNAKTLEMDERTLASKRRVLGDDHPDTARSMTAVAGDYRIIGRHAEAELLLVEALAVLREKIGRYNYRTVATQGDLVMLHMAMGRTGEAIREAEDMATGCEAENGPTHTFTLRAKAILGRVYAKDERFDEALAILRETVEAYDREYGPTHRESQDTLSSLGVVLGEMGRSVEARQTLEESERRALEAGADNVAGLRGARLLLARELIRGEEEGRDPERALELALVGTQDVEEDRTDFMAILAEVHFANGDAESALAVQERVLAALPYDGVDEDEARANLERYAEAAGR